MTSVQQVLATKGIAVLGELGNRYKPLVRDGVAALLARTRLCSPERFANGALSIVTFHRVLPAEQLREYPIPGLVVTPEQLERILRALAAHFSCMPVIDAFRAWSTGAHAGRPLLGISFDDGALDNHEHALPVLQRLGLRASFYIPVANVDEQRAPWHDRLGFALLATPAAIRKQRGVDFERLLAPFGSSARALSAVLPDEAVAHATRAVTAAKALGAEQRGAAIEALEAALGKASVPPWAGMMSWDQVRELSKAGHEIGSHSLSHPILPDCESGRVEQEIVESRRRLQAETAAEVASFCYPNGSYDARCLAAVEAAGYECAVTTTWGLNAPGAAKYELKRCDMDYARLTDRRGGFSERRLLLRLSGLQPGLNVNPERY